MRTWFGVVRAFSSDRGDNISLQKSFSLLSCVWQLLEIVGLSIDVVVVTTSFIHCLGLILVLVVLFLFDVLPVLLHLIALLHVLLNHVRLLAAVLYLFRSSLLSFV